MLITPVWDAKLKKYGPKLTKLATEVAKKRFRVYPKKKVTSKF